MNKVRTYRMLSLALLALALLSCAKQPQETGGDPVSFDSSLTETVTKTTSPLPNNTTFAVFAWYTGQSAWSASAAPNFMYNEDVTYTSPSTYTYAPVKYWPNNTGDKVSFWAYCPHNAAGLTLSESAGGEAYSNTSTTGLPYLDYTTVTGHGLVDLMSSNFDAPVKDLSKPSLNTPVHFVFRHLLSRIVFHFVKVDDDTDNYEVRLTAVTIKNIDQTAGHPGDPSGSWTGHTDNGDMSVYADLTPLTTADNPVVDKDETLADMAVMPIPQILTGTTAKIYISYEVVPTGGGEAVSNDGEYLITDLHTGWVAPAGWEQNYQYTYNVSISPGKPIVFSARIEEWGSTKTWEYHYVD